MESNAVIVIPALNPPSSFVSYAEALRREGFSRIVVVNDGSRTDKLPVFFKLKRLGVTVVDHPHNRGQGAALRGILPDSAFGCGPDCFFSAQ